jgi:hypothetical protein
MKIISILLLVFTTCLGANAQEPGSNAVEGNKTKIRGDGKNDLGYIINIPGLNSYLFLERSSQMRDSSGRYITEFKFGNPNRIIAYHISLVLQFDKQVDSVTFLTDGTAKDIHTTIGDNKLGTSYLASELSANGSITFRLISRKQIHTSIVGVAMEL